MYAGREAAIHIEMCAASTRRVANLRVSRRLSPEGGGGGGGGRGGAWAPLALPLPGSAPGLATSYSSDLLPGT